LFFVIGLEASLTCTNQLVACYFLYQNVDLCMSDENPRNHQEQRNAAAAEEAEKRRKEEFKKQQQDTEAERKRADHEVKKLNDYMVELKQEGLLDNTPPTPSPYLSPLEKLQWVQEYTAHIQRHLQQQQQQQQYSAATIPSPVPSSAGSCMIPPPKQERQNTKEEERLGQVHRSNAKMNETKKETRQAALALRGRSKKLRLLNKARGICVEIPQPNQQQEQPTDCAMQSEAKPHQEEEQPAESAVHFEAAGVDSPANFSDVSDNDSTADDALNDMRAFMHDGASLLQSMGEEEHKEQEEEDFLDTYL
jgi:hypothetical protein